MLACLSQPRLSHPTAAHLLSAQKTEFSTFMMQVTLRQQPSVEVTEAAFYNSIGQMIRYFSSRQMMLASSSFGRLTLASLGRHGSFGTCDGQAKHASLAGLSEVAGGPVATVLMVTPRHSPQSAGSPLAQEATCLQPWMRTAALDYGVILSLRVMPWPRTTGHMLHLVEP